MIQVLLVEDDPMVAELNRLYVNRVEGFGIAASVRNAQDALAVLGEREPGFERRLFELSIAFVVKVGIVDFVVGDEDVHQTIQVVVRNPHSHPLPRMGADAGFRRNVAEGPVTIVQE